MTHLIFDASYISRILDFLCNMLYVCSVFIEFFVQFLGVIKCLDNPYFTICRIAHTKKPHRAKFGHPKLSGQVHPEPHLIQFLPKIAQAQVGHVLLSQVKKFLTCQIKPFARFNQTLHISCVPYRCTRFRNSREKSLQTN